MIEYLNSIAAIGLVLLLAAILGWERLDWEKISKATESLQNVLGFLSNFPKWLQYYNELNANTNRLRDKKDMLQKRWQDLRQRVEAEEFETGRIWKNEVEYWLNSAECKQTELQMILDGLNGGSNRVSDFVYKAWWGNKVAMQIQEVDVLNALGVFEQVLSHAEEPRELPETPLVGDTANKNADEVSTWLSNNEASIIGVHGIKGVGKTALMRHVYNRLCRHGDTKDYVVEIPEDCTATVYYLQSRIATEIGVNLQDEDELRRASFLYRALRSRNFVLILDGLKKDFELERVGVPVDPTKWKLIVTSQSPDVCRKMGCGNYTIKVNPLLCTEAFDLFKQKLGLPSLPQPPLDELAKQIVKKCEGVALKIVGVAQDLRGTDEIDDWQKVLNNM